MIIIIKKLNKQIQFVNVDGSSTPDEFEKYFEELGSGSAEQVPPAEDDDQEFEKKETVSNVII